MVPFQLGISGDMIDVESRPIGDLALDLLDNNPHVRYRFLTDQQAQPGDATYQDRLYSLETTREHVETLDGLMICRPWVKPAAFSGGAQRLVAIGRAGIGYDKIDLSACTEHDVVVFNAPHGLTHSTASAAMIFILMLARRLNLQQSMVRDYRWDLQKSAFGDDLFGRTLGIVGLGETGRELVRLLAPFEMRVIAFSPHADPAVAARLGVTLVGSLDELLTESDYVSLHGRLTPQTHEMIGERELRRMKPTAYFINVARGEMVVQEALVRALSEGWIAGAGLDVFAHEPLPADDPLQRLDNVILTPHWLCSTLRASRLTQSSVLTGMLQVAQGKLPDHIINPAVIDRPGFREKLARHAARAAAVA